MQPHGLLFIQYVRLFPAGKLHFDQRADTIRIRQSSCNMSAEKCKVEARWPAECEITEEELSCARTLMNREPFQDGERLDDWLQIMDEVVGDIAYAYRSSFQLLESNNFKDESILDLLRTLYTFAMAEVEVVTRKTYCSNMSDGEDDCGTELCWPAECAIREEELSCAWAFVHRKPFQDGESLDNWLQIMDEVVGAIAYAYRSSFQLLESNNF